MRGRCCGGCGDLFGKVSRRLQLDRGEMASAPPCGRFRLLHEPSLSPQPDASRASRCGVAGLEDWRGGAALLGDHSDTAVTVGSCEWTPGRRSALPQQAEQRRTDGRQMKPRNSVATMQMSLLEGLASWPAVSQR
jgi:hypothetical protein